MTTVYIPKRRPFPLPEAKWTHNSKVPSAYFQAECQDRINRIIKNRTKEFFSYSSNIQSVLASASAAGARVRWRWAGHSSVATDRVGFYLMIAPSQPTGLGVLLNSYVQVNCTDGGGYNETIDVYFANHNATTVPANFGKARRYFEGVPSNSPLYFFVEDNDTARACSIAVWEESLPADTANGYVPYSYTVGAPILAGDRSVAMAAATDVWKFGASQCFNWTVDQASDARTRTSATDINLLDNSSTSVSAATPGFTLDLRYKETFASGGVPVAFKAYGSMASGTGHVYLKNAAGTVLATININSATPGWFSTTVVLPATEAKYDVHFDGDGTNLVTVHAVSCYEYLA